MTAETTSGFQLLTDHDDIRRWAERRGATPARVRDNSGAVQFAYRDGHNEDLQPITWDEFFSKFDAEALAIFARVRPS